MTIETYIRSDCTNYNKRRKQIQTSIYSYRIYLIDIYIPATYAIYREYEFRITSYSELARGSAYVE